MRKDSFGYRHENHSVGLANVHLVWIPKRRRRVLRGDVRLRLAEILESVAADNKWMIEAKEIASDHVQVVVEYDEKTPICKVVRAFKGRSSRLLRQEFPHLLKLPSLWTRSYFYDTSGKVSTAKIMAYVNDPHHERH
ncbi:MAG: IS200/IS605 family transposase [Leptolyngbya foveolarum]|uniref:IS200/IS605 family transposase n=1 Tax=Leptolyngbya foveolarum TaxID=47253 RepID=A0A2W4UJL8_9CYAN|nr:MAG: IS200/IS605 family transposase [Leptolyngbya foveolarum]